MFFEVKHLSKSFGTTEVISNFSLQVEKGEMVALIDRRGQGMTTLMQMLCGMIHPSSGEIYYNGQKVASKNNTLKMTLLRRGSVAYVPTEPVLMNDLTLYENLMIAMSHKKGSDKTKKRLAKETVEMLGLKGRGRFYPKELNPVERQKAGIAMAMIKEPKLILCDEPTGTIEGYGGEEILGLLEEINSNGVTVIIATHSKRSASCCARVVPIHEGINVDDIKQRRADRRPAKMPMPAGTTKKELAKQVAKVAAEVGDEDVEFDEAVATAAYAAILDVPPSKDEVSDYDEEAMKVYAEPEDAALVKEAKAAAKEAGSVAAAKAGTGKETSGKGAKEASGKSAKEAAGKSGVKGSAKGKNDLKDIKTAPEPGLTDIEKKLAAVEKEEKKDEDDFVLPELDISGLFDEPEDK